MTKFTSEQADLVEMLLARELADSYRRSKDSDYHAEERRENAQRVVLARSCLSTLNKLREVL